MYRPVLIAPEADGILTLVRVEFWLSKASYDADEPSVHVEDFRMKLPETGHKARIDDRGRLLTLKGALLSPDADGRYAIPMDDTPVLDSYRRTDAELVTQMEGNIQRFWTSYLRRRSAGTPIKRDGTDAKARLDLTAIAGSATRDGVRALIDKGQALK